MKTIRITAAILTVLLLALAFASCGGKTEEELPGSYEGNFEGALVTLTLEKNNTGKLVEKNGVSYELTYAVGENGITITLAGQSKTYAYTLENGVLTLTADGAVHTLRK